MLVNFLGAIERVTGSCSWLKHRDTEFLVDCGLIQGEKHAEFENNKSLPFDPSQLKFILLTHAHLDHCGLIPRLYKEGFVGKVYCTSATSKIAKEIMKDAARIGAPYDKSHVEMVQFSVFENMKNFKLGRMLPIDNDLFVAIYRSAHILGSVSISISWNKEVEGKSILFTGDIGNNDRNNPYQPLLKYRQEPTNKISYIVCESTYGSRMRNASECSLDHRIEQLENAINETIYKKHGNLIIPTFSLHRTQEILFDLNYLFSMKWKGGLKKGVHKTKLKHYLEKRGWLTQGKPKRHEFYNELASDPSMPPKVTEKIHKCYFEYFEISKETYTELLNQGFDKQKIKEHTDEKNRLYCLSAYDLEDKSLTKQIYDFLIKINKENNIYYRFEVNELDQSILCDLEESIENPKTPVQVVLDSPLGKRISQIYGEELTKKYNHKGIMKKSYCNPEILNWLNVDDEQADIILKDLYTQESLEVGVHKIKFNKDKKNRLSPRTPMVILTSSGMCDAGPTLTHLENNLEDEKNTILLTGYQPSGTNGNILSNLEKFSLEEKEGKFIRLESRNLRCSDVKAEIFPITGYSGHADQGSLLNYLFTDEEEFKYTVPNIFLNHGDNKTREEFKEKILQRGEELEKKYNGEYSYSTNVIIPKKDDNWYDLENNEWRDEPLKNHELTYNQDLVAAINNLSESIKVLTKEISRKKES